MGKIMEKGEILKDLQYVIYNFNKWDYLGDTPIGDLTLYERYKLCEKMRDECTDNIKKIEKKYKEIFDKLDSIKPVGV